MSASDKKKLRKEQKAAVLSEKQRQAQTEAKKLKIQTIVFVTAMVLVVCVALGYLGHRFVTKSGILEKNTIAATIGNHKLNTVELNYYYVDAINQMYYDAYSDYSFYVEQYFTAMGLDMYKPLDEQTYAATGDTWANYFLDIALDNAQSDYALYDMAMAAGFKLSAEDQAAVDEALHSREHEATSYGYKNADEYMQLVMYGPGASMKSYTEYLQRNAIATAFYNEHLDSLSYTDEQLRAHEQDRYNEYTSFSYYNCYLSYTDFQKDGVKNEDGTYTYTAEQSEAARAALEAAAEKLSAATTVDEIRDMIATIEVGDRGQLAVNTETNRMYSYLKTNNADLANWLSDPERKAGDIGKIAVTATTEDEKTVTNGYYFVVYTDRNEHKEPMGNVRHLLVQFAGGTTDDETGETVYSEEEIAAAKTEAEGYLQSWLDGEATEESFIELVKKYSDDSSAADGGLFEDIHPQSNYVEPFLSWSIDPDRVKGDAEVIETEFGFHVMYYVGDDEMNYRDYMITQELRSADMEEWFTAALDATTVTKKNLSRMNLGVTIAGGMS